MGTKISNEIWDGEHGYDNKIELIGFCEESPREVLKKIFRTHYIINYCGLYRPVDWSYPNNVEGLHIKNSRSQRTRNLKSLDLDVALAELERPRSKETFARALAAAIGWHLVPGKNYNYLDTREQKKDEENEEKIRRLKEVASITLGLKEPTIEDLKRIYEKYSPKQ